jgi:hypothetical protein
MEIQQTVFLSSELPLAGALWLLAPAATKPSYATDPVYKNTLSTSRYEWMQLIDATCRQITIIWAISTNTSNMKRWINNCDTPS